MDGIFSFGKHCDGGSGRPFVGKVDLHIHLRVLKLECNLFSDKVLKDNFKKFWHQWPFGQVSFI